MASERGPLTILESTPQGQCMNGLAQAIIDAAIDGLGDNVWIRKNSNLTKEIPLPAVIIWQPNYRHAPRDGGVSRPDVDFLFAIIIAGAGNREAAWNSETVRILEWELAITRLFAKVARPFSFSGSVATEGFQLCSTNIESIDPRLQEEWKNALDASIIGVACRVRFPNGNP